MGLYISKRCSCSVAAVRDYAWKRGLTSRRVISATASLCAIVVQLIPLNPRQTYKVLRDRRSS